MCIRDRLPSAPVIVTSNYSSDSLSAVSCPSATTCVAVGQDSNVQAFYSVGSESAGSWTWSSATEVASDATTQGSFTGVSCAAVTSCVAVGTDASGYPIFSAGTEASGNWTWTVSSLMVNSYAPEMDGVSCPTTCLLYTSLLNRHGKCGRVVVDALRKRDAR